MSEAEEMALLRMPESTGGRREQAPILEEPGAPQTMGRRMRAERQRRHLTLVQIENELKIRMSYLQAMEDEKYTLLPRGPVALQMVQAYTEYLGLESAPILNEFRSNYYVELAEPIPALGGTRLPHSLPRWLVIVVAVILALAVAIGAILYFDPSFFQNLWAQIMGLFPATQ